MMEYENNYSTNQEGNGYQEPMQPRPYGNQDAAVYGYGYSGGRYSPKPKKKFPWGILVMGMLLCAVLGGIVGAGGVVLLQQSREEQEAQIMETEPEEEIAYILQGLRKNAQIELVQVDTESQMTPAQVYAANVNSTVGITTSVTTNFWGFQSTSAASGSGFIISENGYILTNFHVIDDSDSITVSMYNGDSYEAALIGYDESNDIAVLKIDAEGLAPVIFGDSENLNVGETVVAIGNPLGELTFTLTAGTISAKDREVTLSSNVTMNLLQTDCAINSGNSGGALFNLHGEVIGVTNAKYSNSSSSASIDNIGFAIPINSIRGIVESIIENGYISKPYIGISIMDVSTETQQYGIPAGAAVQAVAENSPASQAGLQQGDVITAANGEAMTSNDLIALIGASGVGDPLVLQVYRQGETIEITVIIGEQIQAALEQTEKEAEQSQQRLPSGFPQGSGRW